MRIAKSCGGSRRQVVWVLATAFSAAAGILLLALLKPALPFRIVAVAVPVICGFGYARQLVRDMQKLDELQMRMYLEAAATACLGVFLVALIYPVVQIAGFVGALQPYYVVFLLTGLWTLGFFNAYRRYR